MEAMMTGIRHRLALDAQRLEGVSPVARFKSGYAFVTGEDGMLIKSIDDADCGSKITVTLADGKLTAAVTDKKAAKKG